MESNEPRETRDARRDTPASDKREERVREIQRLVRANRYDVENKLAVALTRLLNDAAD